MGNRYISLFWRLLVPNVTVLLVACLVLIIEPANGRVPALAGGFALMVAANVVLIRRATTPLVHLTGLMRQVDPLRPGQRLPAPSAQSELTVLADAFNEMLDRLETERRESGMRALSEREGERRRVAAELHDQVGQTLTALGLHVDRVLGRSPADLEDEIRDIRDGVLGSVDDVRRIARELRPEALDTLGLVPALTNLSERMTQRTGIEIVRRLHRDLPPISDEDEVAIYRIAQESLTNSVRHAAASRIEIELRHSAGGIALTISDDGVGFSANGAPQGGILGMRERALSIGADLSIGARPGGSGTQVRLDLPSCGP